MHHFSRFALFIFFLGLVFGRIIILEIYLLVQYTDLQHSRCNWNSGDRWQTESMGNTQYGWRCHGGFIQTGRPAKWTKCNKEDWTAEIPRLDGTGKNRWWHSRVAQPHRYLEGEVSIQRERLDVWYFNENSVSLQGNGTCVKPKFNRVHHIYRRWYAGVMFMVHSKELQVTG